MAPLAQTASTFIVRLWRDSTDGEWRGQITFLPSGIRRRFTTMVELAGLLDEHAPGFGARRANPTSDSTLTPADEVS